MKTPSTGNNLSFLIKIAFWVILAIALGLRIYQFCLGRSLWEDEAHIANNFIGLGYKGLTKPLMNFQSAPVFFLFGVETFTRIFGMNEYALRLYPFLISLSVVPLFYFMVYSLTKDRLASLIGFLVYAVNMFFIYYASELKPYTIEMSAYILLVYLEFTDNPFVAKHRNKLLIAAGVFCIFSANMTMVTFFCIGACRVLKWLRKESNWKQDLPVLGSWAAAFLLNFFLFIYKHPYSEGMRAIWSHEFMSTKIFKADTWRFIKLKIDQNIFEDMLYVNPHYGFKYVLGFLLVVATVNLIRTKRYNLLILAWLPVVVHMVLSMLQLYPIYYRFIMYLLPGIIVLISIGISEVFTFLKAKITVIPASLFVLYCIFCLIGQSVRNFPLHDKEFMPTVKILNEEYPDTKIFVTTPKTLFEYYYQTGAIKNGNMTPVDWNISPEQYYKQVEGQHSNYVLLHSSIWYIDGYKDVMADLKKRNLVLKEYDNKTYTISLIKPLPADSAGIAR